MLLQLIKEQRDESAWIAARFNGELPSEFRLGDNSVPGTGMYHNIPIQEDQIYRVFIRAYTTNNVSTAIELRPRFNMQSFFPPPPVLRINSKLCLSVCLTEIPLNSGHTCSK